MTLENPSKLTKVLFNRPPHNYAGVFAFSSGPCFKSVEVKLSIFTSLILIIKPQLFTSSLYIFSTLYINNISFYGALLKWVYE